MKKAWRVVLIVVVIAIALGGLGIGVGLITGAEPSRVYSILDSRYNIGMYLQYAQDVVAAVADSL